MDFVFWQWILWRAVGLALVLIDSHDLSLQTTPSLALMPSMHVSSQTPDTVQGSKVAPSSRTGHGQ